MVNVNVWEDQRYTEGQTNKLRLVLSNSGTANRAVSYVRRLIPRYGQRFRPMDSIPCLWHILVMSRAETTTPGEWLQESA